MILTEAQTRHGEIIAKRLLIERRELLARIVAADRQLRSILAHFLGKITAKVEAKGDSLGNLKAINATLHDEVVALRASVGIWFRSAVRDSAKMGFRHVGAALTPIFKHNREGFEQELVAGRALFEAKLVFTMKRDFSRRTKPTVALGSAKWADETGRIIRNVTKKNLQGLTASERVWELTTRTEMDLKRIVANGMGAGENPAVIARKIKKYVSPDVQNADELGLDPGQGVYRSPYKNAMRLARTEMNRTYAQAAVSFATDKEWVTGVAINLSPRHADPDDCDENAAGGPYTPEQAGELVPAHPHCMCYITPIIDPKYLGEDDPAPAADAVDDKEED